MACCSHHFTGRAGQTKRWSVSQLLIYLTFYVLYLAPTRSGPPRFFSRAILHPVVDTFPVFSTPFICGYFDFTFKETPSNLFQILKNLQRLRGVAPQTPQRGVAPAPDQGPAGPWTPVQDFQFSNVRPMLISKKNAFLFLTLPKWGSNCS